MKNIVKKFLLSTALVAAACGNVIAAETDWIVGKWELAQDPDGNPKDWMEFSADGKVVSINPKNQSMQGSYSVSPQHVAMVFLDSKGQNIPIMLTHSIEKQELQIRSTKTGNISTYKK